MKNWFKIPVAEAHCDVPCGIYDPITAQVAALSVARLLDLMAETAAMDDSTAVQMKLARLTAEKETHAAEVKAAVVVIWGDYFKTAHLETFPEIHDLTHQILQQASACKQEIAPENGRKLLTLVNRFTEIFWATRNVATHRVRVPYEPKLEIVQGLFDAVD